MLTPRPETLPIVSVVRARQHFYVPNRSDTPSSDAVAKRMDAYFASHPQSPAAVRRPKLSRRGNVWVALLGRSVEDGIVGLGLTVEAALRAFDLQYRDACRTAG